MDELPGVEDEARFAELAMEPDDRAPEERALHVVREPGPNRAVDPELLLESLDPPGPPERHFPDEEWEGPRPARRVDDHEPDLEELLEQQHYAFPGEHRADDRS